MLPNIITEPLSAAQFKPYGEVIETQPQPTQIINQGNCHRYTDLAQLEFTDGGRAGISLFQAKACTLPYRLEYVERHPLGSQAFLPMSEHPFLVIVADDDHGCPAIPKAFITRPGQGINYRRDVWHGVLTPLYEGALFAVVDRIGQGVNLEEHWFTEPYIVRSDRGS